MTVGDVVRQVLRELPPEDRAVIGGVRLLCKLVPDAEDLSRGCTPDQKAAFWGIGRALGVQGSPMLPDPSPAEGEITLFLANLAPLTAERVRIAFAHEVMHALGWDEDTVHAMGLHLDEEAACCG